MVDKLSKYVSWALYVLMAVSAVISILFYTNSLDTSQFLQWGYVLFGLAVVVAIFSPIYGFLMHPKNIMKLLISVGLFAVIAIVAYSLAGNTFSETKLQLLNINASTSKNVGMGLIFTYISFAIAILVILYSSVSKIFK